MTTITRNTSNILSQEITKPHKNSAVNPSNFSKLYGSLESPRQALSQLTNNSNDVDSALRGIDEAINFSTKLMLASAKNMGIPGDGNDNKSQEIAQMAQSVATMMATKANVQAQCHLIQQQKNPVIDLTSLHNKKVAYDEPKRQFHDKPVRYNYNISHSESDQNTLINLILTIRNEQGETIKVVRGSTQTGDFTYEWDGRDDKGNIVAEGEYGLYLEARGYKTAADGSTNPFDVRATTNAIGRVESVQVEDGRATGIIVNNKMVSRENITNIYYEEHEKEIPLTPNLLNKRANLNFSRIKVQPDGSTVICLNNHSKQLGIVNIQVIDNKGQILKNFLSDKKINPGIEQLVFKNINLAPGIYNIKSFIQDSSNPEHTSTIELSPYHSVRVEGINQRQETILAENKEYDIISVDSVQEVPIDDLD